MIGNRPSCFSIASNSASPGPVTQRPTMAVGELAGISQ